MRHGHLIAAVAAALAVTGCGRDRVVAPFMPPVSKYPVLLNPYSVMDALRIAYQDKDSVEIGLLYDGNYQGTSVDLTDPPPIPPPAVLLKQYEVAHVGALARNPSITSVSMIMVPSMQRFDDGADPPGWTTIRNPILSLEVSDISASHQVDIAHDTMDFKFIPTTPVPSSPTDTTWKIIRWTEIRN